MLISKTGLKTLLPLFPNVTFVIFSPVLAFVFFSAPSGIDDSLSVPKEELVKVEREKEELVKLNREVGELRARLEVSEEEV